MSPAAAIRRFAPHEWRQYRELRLRALADSPDAFASTLAEEASRPDAHWSDRLTAGAESPSSLPLVAEIGGAPVGLAWARVDADDPEVVHVYQMWVDPERRRAGVGRGLLDAAIRFARERGARCVRLSVTCTNAPAARLYARFGFAPHGETAPLRPGSALHVQPLELALRAGT